MVSPPSHGRSQSSNPDPSPPAERFGFIPLGIGDLFSRLHYPTSLLVFLGEECLLIDCPSPLPRMLHEASAKSGLNVRMDDIRNVVLTHLHGDHAGGLECLGFYGRFNLHRRTNLWTLPEIVPDLWEHRLSGSMAYDVTADFEIEKRYRLEDFFAVHPIRPGEPAQIGNATIQIRRTKHAPACFGLKILYGQRSLGYSGDTAYDPEHIAFLQDCDVIIHETGRRIHTAYEALAALSEAIQRKLYLIHVEDALEPARLSLPVLEEGRYYPL